MKRLKFIVKSNKRLFFGLTLVAVGLLIASFILPPLGIIDESVISAAWVLFSFAALTVVCYAIEKGADATIRKGDVEVSVSNPDDTEEEKEESNGE